MKIQIPDLRSLQTYAHIPFPTVSENFFIRWTIVLSVERKKGNIIFIYLFRVFLLENQRLPFCIPQPTIPCYALQVKGRTCQLLSSKHCNLTKNVCRRILKIDSNDAQECQIVLEDPSLRYSVVDIIKHESRVWTVIGSLNGDLYFGSSGSSALFHCLIHCIFNHFEFILDAEGVLKHYKISNGKIFSLHWLSCSSSDSKLSLLTCTSNGQLVFCKHTVIVL